MDEGPNPEKGKGPASSTIATNPSGGANGRRVAGKPDPDEYLLERILSRPNMIKAWERVKANKGAPGVDNMPIDDFMAFAREHWTEIRSSHLCRHLPTFAGQEGGDPESNRRHPPPGDSRRA